MILSRSRRARGIKLIELLGCLVAVAGGMWIGANYFGADLSRAAYTALAETEMLDKVPENWRPPNPDCPDGDCPDPEEALRQERQQVRAELESLQEEIARLAENRPETPDPSAPAIELATEEAPLRDRTVGYWNEVGRVVSDVKTIHDQLDSLAGVTDPTRSMLARRKASDYGVRSIELIDREGVDPRAIDTGARVAEWLKQSVDILERATTLSAPEPVNGRNVSSREYMARGEVEYHKRTEYIRQKVAEASIYLRGRYLTEFPPYDI